MTHCTQIHSQLVNLFAVKSKAEIRPSFDAIPHLKLRNVHVVSELGAMGRAPKVELLIRQYVPHHRQVTTKRRRLRTHGRAKWTRYIAKFGERHYPVESITEHLFTVLGKALNMRMAETELVVFKGHLMLFSKVFLNPSETLVHGAQIMGRYLEDDLFIRNDLEKRKKDAQNHILIDDIQNAIRVVYPNDAEEILVDLYKVLLFDALTGCQDRHLFNWGVVEDKEARLKPRLSPCYDTARGLFWRDTESILRQKYYGPAKAGGREKYIAASSPEIGHNTNTKTTHFDLAASIVRCGGPTIVAWARQNFTTQAVSCAVSEVRKEFANLLSPVRLTCIEDVLRSRTERLSQILG